MRKTNLRRGPRAILSVDAGGSHVKVMTSTKKLKREFVSGPDLTAKAMVKQVAELTEDWSYDVVSVGYPGPVVRDRPTRSPIIWDLDGKVSTSRRRSAIRPGS